MNVLDRVQGCNRIIVQGHREIEDQRMEGRGFEGAELGEGIKWKRNTQALGFARQAATWSWSQKECLG